VAIIGMIAGVGAAAAQQVNPRQALRAQLATLSGTMCPAGALSARQQTAGGATVWTTAQEDLQKKIQGRTPGSMGVHVNFDSVKNPVASVELSVSYLPLKLRVMPVAPGADTNADSKKTFVLKQAAALKIDGDLMVGPAATIQTVHLISATFADGSVWRAPNEDSCTVEPSRMLLVTTK
jgi:hypothetical protein